MTKQVIVHGWYPDFSCPGGDCGLTCCSDDWRIALTKEEIVSYESLDHPFHTEICSCINKETESFITVNGYCPLMDENGFCRIVLTMGEQFLSNTCATFPRDFVDYGFLKEAVVEINCPIVARQLFSTKDVDFIASEIDCDDYSISPTETQLTLLLFQIRTALLDMLYVNRGDFIFSKAHIIIDVYNNVSRLLSSQSLTEENTSALISSLLSYDAIQLQCQNNPALEALYAKDLSAVYRTLLDASCNNALESIFLIVQKKLPYIFPIIKSWISDEKSFTSDIDTYAVSMRNKFPTFTENYFHYAIFTSWLHSSPNEFSTIIPARLIELFFINLCGAAILKHSGSLIIQDFSVAIAAIDRIFSHSKASSLALAKYYHTRCKIDADYPMKLIIC